jgi:rfaE bifunctional protein kinase chain/domain
MTGRPPAGRLLAILERASGLPLVVFGDLVMDEFLVGRIDRVSREAPVLILEHQRLVRVPGGGANAAANVAALGGRVLAVGLVGDDEPGAALRGLLAERGIDVSGVATIPGFTTPTKTRVLAGSTTSVQQQVVRIDRGLRGRVEPGHRAALRRALAERSREAAAVLVSDYDHGALDEAARAAVTGGAGGRVITVDSRRRLAAFRGMTAATPNLEEAAVALGRDIPDRDEEVAAAAEELRAAAGARHLVITRGSRGMTVAGEGRPPAHLPVFGTDQVADVTGAGDTVIAALTLALAAGADILEAAHLANVAAGLAVMKRGTATVTPAEIGAVLASG